MTLARACELAHDLTAKTGTPHVVYRFNGWPPAVWGVLNRTHAEVPTNATVQETVHPPSPTMAAPSLF